MSETPDSRRHLIATTAGFGALAAVAVASIVLGTARPVQAAPAPPAPAPPVALAGEASAWVYWTAPGSGITGYTVQATPGGATATVPGTTLSLDFTGLTDATTYTFTVSASNGVAGPASAPSNAVVPGLGAYHPLAPARILDTRSSTRLGPGATRDVGVAGLGGVPASGATAVVFNVTATDTTSAGYLTVWPAGIPRPGTSNVNWPAGKTVANLDEVALGAGGAVSWYNFFGHADVVADVSGWFTDGTGATTGSRFTGIPPARLLDTRTTARLAHGAPLVLQVAGQGGVPGTGAPVAPTAVVL